MNYHRDNWPELLSIIDYTQLILPHESLGMSPFELLSGYELTTSLDWNQPIAPVTAREHLNHDKAQAYANTHKLPTMLF